MTTSTTQLEPTQEQLQSAARLKSYRPFMRVWIALRVGEEARYVQQATASKANALARKGWTVYEVK